LQAIDETTIREIFTKIELMLNKLAGGEDE